MWQKMSSAQALKPPNRPVQPLPPSSSGEKNANPGVPGPEILVNFISGVCASNPLERVTVPRKFNSLPLKSPLPKKVVCQAPFFRGYVYVKLRVCICISTSLFCQVWTSGDNQIHLKGWIQSHNSVRLSCMNQRSCFLLLK